MIIDWFTLIAQALNFLILLWLLKHFLYQPILDAIDSREKRIASTLAEAEAKKAEAFAEKKDFQRKNEQLDQQRSTLMSKAAEEAKTEGQRLLNEARLAVEAYRAKRLETLAREQQSLNDEILRRTREEVFAIARKALTDLADTSLEKRMSKVLQRRLRELSDEQKDSLDKAFKLSLAPVVMRSAFLLPPEQQKELQQALNDTFSSKMNIRFETAPEMVSGIEIIANGHKIAWSIVEYLNSLEKSMSELLQEKTKPQPTVEEMETNVGFSPDSRRPHASASKET